MYVSIDRKGHKFLHKHASSHVVANLDFLCGVATDIEHVEPHTLHICTGWADADLQKLFKRTTGQDSCPYVGDTLRVVLTELAARVPTSNASVEHSEGQCVWLELRQPKGGGYFYNPGAWMPLPQSPGWEPAALVTQLSADECTAAVRARNTAAAQRAASLPAPTPVAPRSTAPSASREPRVAGAPRSGVCAAIWTALDAELAADPDGVPPTRERVKVLAQANGWNSSTASVQFAAWRKHNNLA